MFESLLIGFEAAMTLTNMAFICGGVLLGIVFGVLPGIGFLLGPLFELSFRQTMLMYRSDLSIMLTSPISLIFVALTVYFLWRFGFQRRK